MFTHQGASVWADLALLQYLSRFQHSLAGWDQDAKAALLLAGALENDH